MTRSRPTLRDIGWPRHVGDLTLRPAAESDAEAVYAIRNSDGQSMWLSRVPTSIESFAERFCRPQYLERRLVGCLGDRVVADFMFAICDAWSQAEVADGACGVAAELGWVIDPELAGQGHVSAVLPALLDIGFVDLGLHRLKAQCFVENTASWRLMEKVGMRREAHTVRSSLHRQRGWSDAYHYAILAEEWRSIGAFREQVADPSTRAVVFDLDGVLRHFDPRDVESLEYRLGLEPGQWSEVAFSVPQLHQAVVGESTFDRWAEAIIEALADTGVDTVAAIDATREWIARRGRVAKHMARIADDLTADGVPCFVFTNGTDNVGRELRQVGLGRYGTWHLINSAELGHAKPASAAFEAAHAQMSRRLEERGATAQLERSSVVFTDDRKDNVDAACGFGWRAVQHVSYAG